MVFFFDTRLSLLILFAFKELIKLAKTNISTHIHIMKKTLAVILLSTALAVGSTNAAIVFGNLGATGSGAIATTGGASLNTSWRAIGFMPAGTDLVLNSATIGLNVSSAGSADIRLDLYTQVSGAPGVSFFNTTQTVNASTLNQPITFTLNETLSAGTAYYLVAQKTSGAGAVNWRAPNPTIAPTGLNGSGWSNLAGQTAQYSTDGGSSWFTSGSGLGGSFAISLDASPIPEPGTWAAMAIFASGAAYAGWRRRKQQQQLA